MRICKVCGKEFIPTGKNQRYCKECSIKVHSEEKKQWRKDNPEKVKESLKNWRKTHSIIEYKRRWRKDNPEKEKTMKHRANAKRRELDFIPLNEWFEGSDGHHIDPTYVIYMFSEVHRSIYHDHNTGRGMDEMNALAMNYL